MDPTVSATKTSSLGEGRAQGPQITTMTFSTEITSKCGIIWFVTSHDFLVSDLYLKVMERNKTEAGKPFKAVVF